MLWKILAWIVTRPRIKAWLIARAQRTPYDPITSPDGSEIYMGRWWLFNPYDRATRRTRWSWCPISVRIHHIRTPDRDRHLHDHPWNARTIILDGWYAEQLPEPTPWRELRVQGDTNALRFGQFHRIAHVGAGGCWTLFITGKYRGTWGFQVKGRKVPYTEYPL